MCGGAVVYNRCWAGYARNVLMQCLEALLLKMLRLQSIDCCTGVDMH